LLNFGHLDHQHHHHQITFLITSAHYDRDNVHNQFVQEWRGGHETWRKAHPSLASKLKPARLPKKLDVASAKTCTPPGGQLYFSITDQRVRAYYLVAGHRHTFSASRELYGDCGALKQCLKWLWAQHCDEHVGQTCPYAELK
jgi:hypothetical protein